MTDTLLQHWKEYESVMYVYFYSLASLILSCL